MLHIFSVETVAMFLIVLIVVIVYITTNCLQVFFAPAVITAVRYLASAHSVLAGPLDTMVGALKWSMKSLKDSFHRLG